MGTFRPSVLHEQDDKQLAIVKGIRAMIRLVGSLLSVFTPEPDQHDANEPMPKKRKKEKQR